MTLPNTLQSLRNLNVDRQSALSSHTPLSFASMPQPQSETLRQSTARLLYRSHWNLNTETARDEPRLRRLLGHVSVYDRIKASAQAQAQPQTESIPTSHPEENELSTYLQHQVPSFEEFRAALKVQLETISQIRLANATQCNDVDEYDSDETDESDYDSCDGDWSDEDAAAESDDSLTDLESEANTSPCTSPTFESAAAKYDKEEDENDLWAIRPLKPFLTSNRVVAAS